MKRVEWKGTAYTLFRTGILSHKDSCGCKNSKLTIDVDRLFYMADEEILKCRSIGPHKLKEVNAARDALKRLLFKDK